MSRTALHNLIRRYNHKTSTYQDLVVELRAAVKNCSYDVLLGCFPKESIEQFLDFRPGEEKIENAHLKKAIFYYLFQDTDGKSMIINEAFISKFSPSEPSLLKLLKSNEDIDLSKEVIHRIVARPQSSEKSPNDDASSQIFWHIFRKIETSNEAYQFLLDHGFDKKSALKTISINQYEIEPEWFKTVVNGLNPDLYIFTNASEDTVSSIFLSVYSSFTDASRAKHFLSDLWRNYHNYLRTTAVASLNKLIKENPLNHTEIKSVCSHLEFCGYDGWYELFIEQKGTALTIDERGLLHSFIIRTPKATNLCEEQAAEAFALLQYKLGKAGDIALNDFRTSNDLLFHFFTQSQPVLEQSLQTAGHLLTQAEMKRPHLLFVIQYAILQMKTEYTQEKFNAKLYQRKLFDNNSDTSHDFDEIRSLNSTKKWDLLIDTSIDQLSRSGYDQELLSEEQKGIVMNWAKHKLKEEFRSYAADNDFVKIFDEMCKDPSEENVEKLQHAFYKHKTLSEKAIELIRMVLKWLGITPILGRACLFAEKHFLPTPVKINKEVDRLCSVVSNHSAPSA